MTTDTNVRSIATDYDRAKAAAEHPECMHPLDPCDLCGVQHTHVRDHWNEDGSAVPFVAEHRLGDTAVRFDYDRRMIIIDYVSSGPEDSGPWSVLDLRLDPTVVYGDFHALKEARDCFDQAGCASQHGHIALD